MILKSYSKSAGSRRTLAMTLTEMLVAIGVGSIVLVLLACFSVYGIRSYLALGNYSALDQQSRLSIDKMTREIRQATALVASSTNSPKSLTFTNLTKGTGVKYYWNSTAKELRATYSDVGDKLLLQGCTDWTFDLKQRTPSTNQADIFYAATNAAMCKLVNMSWKCSRSVGKTKLLNTENIQTTMIVLRNQQSK